MELMFSHLNVYVNWCMAATRFLKGEYGGATPLEVLQSIGDFNGVPLDGQVIRSDLTVEPTIIGWRAYLLWQIENPPAPATNTTEAP